MKNTELKPLLITFDWDGTLLDTRDCVVTNMNKTLAAFGLPSWEEAKKLRDNTLSLKENFPNFFGKHYTKAYGHYLVEYRSSMKTLLKRIEGTDALLHHLHAADIRFGIISNKEQSLLEEERDYFFSQSNFCLTYGDGAAKRNKPFPDPIDKAIEECHLNKETATIWHVGDSGQDIDAAKAAGVTPVLIKKHATFKENIATADTLVFEDIPALTQYIKERFFP